MRIPKLITMLYLAFLLIHCGGAENPQSEEDLMDSRNSFRLNEPFEKNIEAILGEEGAEVIIDSEPNVFFDKELEEIFTKDANVENSYSNLSTFFQDDLSQATLVELEKLADDEIHAPINQPILSDPIIEARQETKLALEKAELEKTELEKTELEKPELEKPEFEKTELEKPELEKPELEKPELEKPELENLKEPVPQDSNIPETSEIQENQTELSSVEESSDTQANSKEQFVGEETVDKYEKQIAEQESVEAEAESKETEPEQQEPPVFVKPEIEKETVANADQKKTKKKKKFKKKIIKLCAKALGTHRDQIIKVQNLDVVKLDQQDSLLIDLSKSKEKVVKLDSMKNQVIDGLCLISYGSHKKNKVVVNYSVDKVAFISRGKKSRTVLKVGRNGAVAKMYVDIKGKGSKVVIKGKGHYPCPKDFRDKAVVCKVKAGGR